MKKVSLSVWMDSTGPSLPDTHKVESFFVIVIAKIQVLSLTRPELCTFSPRGRRELSPCLPFGPLGSKIYEALNLFDHP